MTDLHLTGEITREVADDLCEQFRSAIYPCRLIISDCVGGDLLSAMRIIAQVEANSVFCYGVGSIRSAGTMIWLAASEGRDLHPDCTIHLHYATYPQLRLSNVTEAELADLHDELARDNEWLALRVASAAMLSEADARALLAEDKILTREQAKKTGLLYG